MSREINDGIRYARQLVIEGWNQKSLQEARVALVGTSGLGKNIFISLAALGVGTIIPISNRTAEADEFILEYKMDEGQEVVRYLEQVAEAINPSVEVCTLTADLDNPTAETFLAAATLVIDATNDPRSKAICLHYAKNKVPVLSASCMDGYGKLTEFLPSESPSVEHLMEQFAGKAQDELISAPMAGLIVNEAKKLIMHEPDEEQLHRPLYIKLGGTDRFSYLKKDRSAPKSTSQGMAGKKALMIGAGALGNHSGPIIAKMGYSLVDIVDFDKIEATNLNRQVYFREEEIGESKAEVLAPKLSDLSLGKTMFRGLDAKFDLDFDKGADYDIVFDLVDNLYTRALINAYCVKNKTPLISAATDFKSGRWATYVPGKTPCMNHLFNIYSEGLNDERIRRQSCARQPNASVIMTNQVSGGLAALEALAVFDETYEVIPGVLRFMSNYDSRLGIDISAVRCDCHKKEIPDLSIKE